MIILILIFVSILAVNAINRGIKSKKYFNKKNEDNKKNKDKI